MMVYDIIMIVVIVAATAWGVYKGLIWQIASLGSIVASYFVAYQFRGVVAANINASPPWNTVLAMLLLYLGTSAVIWIAFRFIKEAMDKIKLKEFDNHVGGVLGFAKGVVLCIVITLFAVTLLGEREQDHIIRSHSGYFMAVILDKSHNVLPLEMNETVHALVHKLDGSLPDGYEHAHDHGHDAPGFPSVPVGGNGPFDFGTGNGFDDNRGADNGNGLFR